MVDKNNNNNNRLYWIYMLSLQLIFPMVHIRGALHHVGWNLALYIIKDEVTAVLQSDFFCKHLKSDAKNLKPGMER